MHSPDVKPGVFVAVAGPSGSGKDSLIAGARRHFGSSPDIVFVRRCITRAADAFEDHEPLTPLAFRLQEEQGGFALAWHANGLSYGLPAAIRDDLGLGKVVVANVSRDVIPKVRDTFPRSLVIHVTADMDVLSDRLARRCRETEADQGARLARNVLLDQAVEADIRIENNGLLADAERRFIETLHLFVRPLRPARTAR